MSQSIAGDIRQFCIKRMIDEDTYISILLSLDHDRITVFGDADSHRVELLCRELVSVFRKKYLIRGVDFEHIK